jgi:hypothetical protein
VSRTALDPRLHTEFDRQVERLVRLGYPASAGMTDVAFLRLLAPLVDRLPDVPPASDPGHIPFVLVTTRDLVAPGEAMPLVELEDKPGFTEMPPEDLDRFRPIDGVDVPHGSAYLIADVETGRGTLNVTPDQAPATFTRQGRSPLTIDEGVALITQVPRLLEERHCFSMVASRCGDRRVPAVWISRNHPRLGWCWAGMPHEWLGSASCAVRLGARG